MGWLVMSNEDRTFKVKFNTLKSKPIKVQLNKTSSVLDVRMDINVPAEETYFDDIIIYTQGGNNEQRYKN